jgi:hypothetical protein
MFEHIPFSIAFAMLGWLNPKISKNQLSSLN